MEVLTRKKYFKKITIKEYCETTKDKFPFLYSILDFEKFDSKNIENLFGDSNIIDFEGDAKGGRGQDYFLSQNQYPLNRKIGFQSIFDLIDRGEEEGEKKIVLDILGGNGTLYRAAEMLNYFHLQIIINDISEAMVENAYNQSIPCIRQPAQNLLFIDSCLDAVIYAYGTHHIPIPDRLEAFKETYRVLKDNGVIVFHDYEEQSITSKWYSEALHEFTYTGHDFIHFYKEQLKADLYESGFEEIEVFYNYDPFVIEGTSAQDAKESLLDHLISLFGMKKFKEKYDYDSAVYFSEAEKLVRKYSDFLNCDDPEINSVIRFKELTIYKEGDIYYAEMPRFSLMARGIAKKQS